MTSSAEQAIQESEKLRSLYDMCKATPFFSSRKPRTKSIISKNPEKVLLTLSFSITGASFVTVSQTARSELLAKGWTIVEEDSGLWEEQIEFKKDQYWVQITHGNFGASNYGLNCRDYE